MAQNRKAPNQASDLAHNRSQKATKTITTVTARQSLRLTWLAHILTGACTVLAAIATGSNLRLVQLMESQARSLFFEIRGPVAPPSEIVILAVDDESLSAADQYYLTDPQKYAHLKPLKAWPWERTAYAQVIEKLMAAGAKSVALDILLTTPSSYGSKDDQHLANVLNRYPGKVTLAAEYAGGDIRQGSLIQLSQPENIFWTQPKSIGTVNFPVEADGKVHRFASVYPQLLAQKYKNEFIALQQPIPSFEVAVAQAALPNLIKPKGEYINFYGPTDTFEYISFWHVLDPSNWNTYLEQGKYFKDKIVLIGGTASSLQDFHGSPFSRSWLYPERMAGVEIQANAIASLLTDRAISQAIPNLQLRGLLVLILVGTSAVLLNIAKRAVTKFVCTIFIVGSWVGISYFSFVQEQLILPVATPIVAIAFGSCSYLATAAVSDRLRKLNLRRTLERYASSPVVREIISQQDDLQYLLYQRELATLNKIIGGRYKIVKVLGSGGFSETYIAEDIQRPGNPLCVVKQLRVASTNPKQLAVARRLFKLEAETLEKLGVHNQIPQLYAYFEEAEEFYLVQELIVGHPLSYELVPGRSISEVAVMQILQDLLQTLEFVHNHEVIHRDIKPSNIVRRHADGKLVLIDFGAVKEVTTQLLDNDGQTGFTIGIGTQGYAPSEQCAGRVRFSSDIYAVGMIAIKALSGLSPHELQLDAKTGEFLWMQKSQISPQLAAIVSKMVRYDFNERFQSASEALAAIEELTHAVRDSLPPDISSAKTILADELEAPTAPWVNVTTEVPESPTISFPPQQNS